MKTKNLILAALLIAMVLMVGESSATGYGGVIVSLNNGDDVAYIGETNTIEFWIENDATVEGMNLGFEFNILANYQFDPNHGGAGLYVQEHGRAIGAFDAITGLIEIAKIDDFDPDSLLMGGGTFPGLGIPPGGYELCYTMQVDILPGSGEMAGGFSIDNVFIPPPGTWTFVDAAGSYPPDYQGNPNSSEGNPDAPAVAFDIINRPNIPPVITNCPTEPLYISHSEMLYYHFDAEDPDEDLPLFWEVVAGVGAIDANTGDYFFDPDEPGAISVTVRVTDTRGADAECTFDIQVTNEEPAINCEPNFFVTEHCMMFEHQFTASDPNPEDVLTWSIISGDGWIESATGLYMLDPYPYVGGVLPVEIQVTDGWGDYDECFFEVMVVNNAPVFINSCTDTIAGVPGGAIEFQFQAFDPDPCDPLVFLIESVVPEPLGEYYMIYDELYFEPLPDDAGSLYEFTIIVDDGWDYAVCQVKINVLLGDDCAYPIEIYEIPFAYYDSLALYHNLLQPNIYQCGGVDSGFGEGPEMVILPIYEAIEGDTLLITLTPLGNWDACLYVMNDCDMETCYNSSDNSGEGEAEYIKIPLFPGITIIIIIDSKGLVDAIKRFILQAQLLADPYCEIIERSDLLADDAVLNGHYPGYPGFGTGRTNSWTSLRRQQQTPNSKCEFGYKIKTSGGFLGARVSGTRFRMSRRPGYAKSILELTGSYEVKPDPTGATSGVECTLAQMEIRGTQWIIRDIDVGATSYLQYKKEIQPFFNEQIWYPPASSGGILECNDPPPCSIIRSFDVGFDPVISYVPFNIPQQIKLTFTAETRAGGRAASYADFSRLHFKINCPCRPEGAPASSPATEYPVEMNLTNLKVSQVGETQDTTITVPDDFSWNFTLIDSTRYENGGIAYSTLPGFSSGLYLTNRINDFAYENPIDSTIEFPCDSSGLFLMSSGSINPVPLADALTAPSQIAFDEIGFFNNKLYVAQAEFFSDVGGYPVTGSGLISSIDESGNISTLVGGLDSPVALAFGDGGLFGSDLYIVENIAGEIKKVTPGGGVSTMATGLKAPVDLALGSSAFAGYLYVAEYDTSFADSIPEPNSGKICRVDQYGNVTTFVDALQTPTAVAFAPGGIFGTDLYVLLDNEYNDSTFYEPNTGKIVTIDPSGTVTDFATGLNSPQYLTFDPDGVLYVSVGGGVVRIATYICGDADGSGAVDISDAVYLIAYIFSGGPVPNPLEAGDADCSGAVDISDAVYLISYIFGGGPIPCDPDGDTIPDC